MLYAHHRTYTSSILLCLQSAPQTQPCILTYNKQPTKLIISDVGLSVGVFIISGHDLECAAETVMKTITEELAMGSDTQHEDNKELKYIAGQVYICFETCFTRIKPFSSSITYSSSLSVRLSQDESMNKQWHVDI